MSETLKGKVALVAGASRGCGRGGAVALGEQAATVYASLHRFTGTAGIIITDRHFPSRGLVRHRGINRGYARLRGSGPPAAIPGGYPSAAPGASTSRLV